ncbi:J domain-containing protein [Saccharopolyspora erythraea]|uniref:J domain-containing protein n=1 Tax=Saccharopolyspora erythraea TaxID=1836 RepID=UPI0001D312D0|nr:DnaJ domain-containing protein [Saccharopolyspora erythraea]EQD86998.1 molecular chaperone DnaJ [Saccharopolyspora erythraea D]
MGEFVRGVDYYELLGVDREATAAEIKSAYRTLARTMHPDVGGTAGTFRLLREAFETLNDPVRRADYDGVGVIAEMPVPVRRPRTRRAAAPRREFGDDPDFVPGLPRLSPDDIPWWDLVDPDERIRYVPVTGPESGPVMGLLGGWTLLLLAGLAVELDVVLMAVWLSLLVAAGVVVLLLLRRFVEARRTDRLFAAEFRGRKVFGKPDDQHDAPPKQLTAELLATYLTRLPGVRIFHGLAWPESVFADVDHAVLCGRRLVLIESKRWLPGHYNADEDGVLWRNGHPFRGGGTRLPEGVAAFADLLPDIEVRGALVIYPSRAGEVTTGEQPDSAAAPLTPEQFVREIGEWLAAEPAVVDRDIFGAVLQQVVSD